MKAFLVSFAASALCLSVNLPAQDAKPPSQGVDVRPRIYLTPADVVRLLQQAMKDDALNCHGTHLRIVGKPAESRLLMWFMQKQTFGFAAFQPCDEVAVINHNDLPRIRGQPAAQAANHLHLLITTS